MFTSSTLSDDRRDGNRSHSVALWAGLTTLFANLAAINIVALLGDESDAKVTALAAVITSMTTAAAVYARERLNQEKRGDDRRQPSSMASAYAGDPVRDVIRDETERQARREPPSIED